MPRPTPLPYLSVRSRRGAFRALALPVFGLWAGAAAAHAQAPAAEPAGEERGGVEPPPLVVFIVVDQLRADLLDRYGPAFRGGLARLGAEGFRYLNATHDHAVTETAPGHATLATGTEPYQHGVVSNAWTDYSSGQPRPVMNVVDPETALLDDEGLMGASPRVLQREGLADWLQSRYDGAKVVSLSGKDRGAVLLAGHSRAHVYWFSGSLGRFVTSTHYRDRYPGWVSRFNDDELPGFAGDSTWALQVPEGLRHLARPDAAPFEGDGEHTTFPHRYADQAKPTGNLPPTPFWSWWATTPSLDAATLALARAAVEAEGLGADDHPDLLALGLSQTDRVGHSFGPGSLEQLDNLMRLDQELGHFLDWLDDRLGEGRYLVTLTADHGVQDAPEAVAADVGYTGLRLPRDSAAALQRTLDRLAGEMGMADLNALGRALAAEVTHISWIDRAWTHGQLGSRPVEEMASARDSFTVLQRRNHVPGRPADLLSKLGVEIQRTPGVLLWTFPRGTTHGTPYHYDRHVPLIFWGAGIKAGASEARVSATDVAPTLGALLGLELPGDLDGRPLLTRARAVEAH